MSDDTKVGSIVFDPSPEFIEHVKSMPPLRAGKMFAVRPFNDGWLKCSEALPEEGVRVLAYSSDGKMEFARFSRRWGPADPLGFSFLGGDWCAFFPGPDFSRRGWDYGEHEEHAIVTITHWKKVPEPPK